jgi:hypothetical protein
MKLELSQFDFFLKFRAYDKERGKMMKINEPKTPYHHENDDEI